MAREFFGRESAALARTCHAMARAFARGGTLIPFGAGPAATDAAHAAVEFMHPVIVGKRALPALAPGNDPTGLSTLARLARPGDIALALSHQAGEAAPASFIAEARSGGLLTISMEAESSGSAGAHGEPVASGAASADHRFAVPSDDPAVVQEVQETAYHVLWELVHVFLEQPALLDDGTAEACITCGDAAVEVRVAELQGPTAVVERDGAFEQVAVDLVEGVRVGDRLLCHAGVALQRAPEAPAGAEPAPAPAGPAGFLYPFLEGGRAELGPVLAEVEASTIRKSEEAIALRERIDADAVARCGADLRERLEAGGRLIAFGNGGSATDAQDLAADALARGWPALALGNDAATVTAVANDVGFELIFARQLIALARPEDVAVGISTSGGSPNLVEGLEEAGRRGMLTVATAGYDGGALAGLDRLDHLFVVPSDHIPRIQEAQATICHLLLDAAGDLAAPGDR